MGLQIVNIGDVRFALPKDVVQNNPDQVPHWLYEPLAHVR